MLHLEIVTENFIYQATNILKANRYENEKHILCVLRNR